MLQPDHPTTMKFQRHIEQELQERDKMSVITDSAFELRVGSNPGRYLLQTHALDEDEGSKGRHFEDTCEMIAAP